MPEKEDYYDLASLDDFPDFGPLSELAHSLNLMDETNIEKGDVLYGWWGKRLVAYLILKQAHSHSFHDLFVADWA